jgi:hypothetical protein
MTDSKQKTPPGDPLRASDRPDKDDEDPGSQVFIRNTTRAPIHFGSARFDRERVSAIPADVWKQLQEHELGKALIEDGSLEEASEDELAEQPKTADQLAEEQDEAAQKAAGVGKKKGAKK